MRKAVGNPFSTRHTRPGAIAYRFPPEQSAERVVERLRAGGWRGQILGPHGSGKSTLLAAVLPALQRAGQRPLVVELHDGQRRLPADFRRMIEAAAAGVVVVDGYEQLAPWNRYRLRRLCRRRKLGLLVTTHRSAGLPDLFCTEVAPEVAWDLVEHLLAGFPPLVTPEQLRERLARHRGNLREVFFDLYDLYERGSL
jgi:hypothetical protein